MGEEMTDNGFKPSAYQQAIFAFITNGRGNGIVNAVAGSGKTTTLVKAAELLSTASSLFVAFNKHIATELNERLEGTDMTARTVHSIGYGCKDAGSFFGGKGPPHAVAFP